MYVLNCSCKVHTASSSPRSLAPPPQPHRSVPPSLFHGLPFKILNMFAVGSNVQLMNFFHSTIKYSTVSTEIKRVESGAYNSTDKLTPPHTDTLSIFSSVRLQGRHHKAELISQTNKF
jgi:hypothetical protein